MPFLKILFPYDSYDFGFGIPPITNTGTEITDQQLDDISSIILSMRARNRPRVEEIPGPVPPAIPIPDIATRAWVTGQLAELDIGGQQYVHVQTAPAASWPVTHNRGARPPVVLFLDSAPEEPVFADVTYVDDDHVLIELPSPETGKAYI